MREDEELGVTLSGKTPTKVWSCFPRGWLSEFSWKDSSDSCSESVWSQNMNHKYMYLQDLSSEWQQCLESEDLFVDLSGDIYHLLDDLGFFCNWPTFPGIFIQKVIKSLVEIRSLISGSLNLFENIHHSHFHYGYLLWCKCRVTFIIKRLTRSM